MNIGPFPLVLGNQETNSPITYKLFKDGIYITKKVMQGYVTYKVDGINGLPEGKEEVNILPRKIPINIYWAIVKFFRFVSHHFGTKVESYIEIGYNPKEDRYFLYVPEQEVSRASVKRDPNQFKQTYSDCYIVAEFHNHCGFKAYFSSIDNNDSKRDMFSGVIGFEDKCMPDYVLRLCCSGKFWDFELDDIFSNSEEYINFDFEEAIKNIFIVNNKTILDNNYQNRSLWDMLKFKMNTYNKELSDFLQEESYIDGYK